MDVESNKLSCHWAHAASVNHLLRWTEEIIRSQIYHIAYCCHVDEWIHEPARCDTITEVQGLLGCVLLLGYGKNLYFLASGKFGVCNQVFRIAVGAETIFAFFQHIIVEILAHFCTVVHLVFKNFQHIVVPLEDHFLGKFAATLTTLNFTVQVCLGFKDTDDPGKF